MYITEQNKIPVTEAYDTIIVGGGIAGISAALAASRNGAKTLLIERMFMLGGLATAGLVTIYLPLCDGNGRQVSFGLAEELLKLSVKYGHEIYPENRENNIAAWLGDKEHLRKDYRYEVQFSANVFAILLEQLLRNNNVDILYGTTLCSAMTEEKKIKYIITENKTGREAYMAKSFVDASGDADLCRYSGMETCEFSQGNVLASWHYEHIDCKYILNMQGFADVPDKYKDGEGSSYKKRYKGLSGKELSEMVCDAHDAMLKNFLNKGQVETQHALATIPTIPQIRMTRRICGKYTMNDEEKNINFDDSIGMIGDWRKAGPVYEIPFSTLYSEKIKNLIVCGRCISVTDDMWDITRVIPACAVTGQAAGTAAAMTDDFLNLDVAGLQKKLRSGGVKIHINEL